MKTSGITAALPAQDLGRAKAFYVEKVGLQALESDFLKARNGQVGLTVGDGVNQLFVYPAQVRSSGEFTQAVIHVAEVRAVVEEMRGRGVDFEEYDTPETRTENGIARMPGGGEAAWFKDSEGTPRLRRMAPGRQGPVRVPVRRAGVPIVRRLVRILSWTTGATRPRQNT
jgi:predicted enzyme related to lactoylglutathione lyase